MWIAPAHEDVAAKIEFPAYYRNCFDYARRYNRGWIGLDLDAQPCRLAKPFAAGLQQRP